MSEPTTLRDGEATAAPPRRALWLLIAVFFASSLPTLPLLSRYRGDERYYSDAVLLMQDRGDPLTPLKGNGDLRFRKPILAYWPILLSYEAFGVSYLTTRLPHLLSSCAALALAFVLARRMFRRTDVALLAAVMLAANTHMLNTSIRTTPDALQITWALVSMIGLVGLALPGAPGQRRRADSLLFYGGAGMVFATKGGLGLLLVGFGFAAVAMLRRMNLTEARPRDLISIPAMLLGLALGAWWYVAIFLMHGSDAVATFFGDQVGERFEGSKIYILENALLYPLMFIVDTLPFSAAAALLAWGRRESLRQLWRDHGPAIAFTLLFTALLYLIFTFGNIYRTRYFYPAHPLLLAAIAAILGHPALRDAARDRLIAFLVTAGLIGFAVVGAAQAALGGFVAPMVAVGGALLIIIAVGAIVVTRRAPVAVRLGALAVVILLSARVYDLTFRPATFNSAAPELAAQLTPPPGDEPVRGATFGVDETLAAQVRVLSRGRVHLAPYRAPSDAHPVSDFDVIVIPAARARDWALHYFRSKPVAEAPELTIKRLIQAATGEGLDATLDDEANRYVIARRPNLK